MRLIWHMHIDVVVLAMMMMKNGEELQQNVIEFTLVQVVLQPLFVA